jgi:hypothetical protein
VYNKKHCVHEEQTKTLEVVTKKRNQLRRNGVSITIKAIDHNNINKKTDYHIFIMFFVLNVLKEYYPLVRLSTQRNLFPYYNQKLSDDSFVVSIVK